MNCPYEEDVAPYTLGALPSDERDRVAQHLAVCSVCADLHDEFSPVSLMLLDSAVGKPPRAMRRSVLGQVEAQAALFAAAGAPERGRWQRPRPVFVAAAMVAVLAAFVSGSTIQSTPAQESSVVFATTTSRAQAATVQLHHAQGEDWQLVTSALPVLPSGMEYKLWGKTEDGRVVGMEPGFVVDDGGRARVSIAEDRLKDMRWILATSQPVASTEPESMRMVFQVSVPHDA